MTYHFGFIVEQALGHATHGQNLKQHVVGDSSIHAEWCFPTQLTTGLAGKISNWTVSAGLQARKGLAATRQRGQLDGLFFHTQVTAILCQDWLRRVPSVVSLDATPLQYDELGEYYNHHTGPTWLELGKSYLTQSCLHAARHIVTWSDWAKQSLIADYHIPDEKITIIPPGVNTQAWSRPAQSGQATDRPLRILFVGGDFERKGGYLLLEAFQSLRQSLLESGTDAETAIEVELCLVTKENIPLTPGVCVYNNLQPNSDELKQLYFDSDIFCLPTLGDCLPMVLSEAGAVGLPTVASSVAAIPELIRHELTGLIVNSGQVTELKDALLRLVSDPEFRAKLGAQAARHARQNYDSGKNSEKLLMLMKSIADGDCKK